MTSFVFLWINVFVSVAGVFERGVGLDVGSDEESSEERDTDATPARWAFQIWIPIFIWQLLWSLYTITLIFRKSDVTDRYLYISPAFLPSSFYAIFILHLSITVTWLFAFDNEFNVASFVALSSMALTLYVCVFFAVYLMWIFENELSRGEIWSNIVLVHNGLALYATWSTVATLLTLRTMLVETLDVRSSSAAIVVLSLLLIIVVVYPALEMFTVPVRLRYVLTPYLTLGVALAGLLDAHDWDNDSDSTAAILKIVTSALLAVPTVVKVGVTAYRGVRHPTKAEGYEDDEDDE